MPDRRILIATVLLLLAAATTAAALSCSGSGGSANEAPTGEQPGTPQTPGTPTLPQVPTNPPYNPNAPFDPIALAASRVGMTRNLEASVPSMCYTKTDGVSNPCWTCHTVGVTPNNLQDYQLQEEYAFSDFATTNQWTNLFVDRSAEINAITDAEALAYIRQDNYAPLKAAMASKTDFPGFKPDLDFAQGFDAEGFARDGSGWRAIRYKPFLGTFWPTNGNNDDVFVRLPAAFRRDANGQPSREIEKANLSILEAAIRNDPSIPRPQVELIDVEVEPLNEDELGVDLNGDGVASGMATRIKGLPKFYLGQASTIPVERYKYPQYVEFLHSVRYVDPDDPRMMATRMKELRYSRKVYHLDEWAMNRAYEIEYNEKEEGRTPIFAGDALGGLRNSLGWLFQGYIEDAQGRLRLQADEETRFCMGCHGTTGVAVDNTFTLARKVPGLDGWRHQDLRGIKDHPQMGHAKPEILTYFERVQGGDEFRANAEVISKFFDGVQPKEAEVLRAAHNGDKDITHLIFPSRERAIALNKAYIALVRRQGFEQGRDTLLAPPANVHREIENGDTALKDAGKIFTDGRLWLDWSR